MANDSTFGTMSRRGVLRTGAVVGGVAVTGCLGGGGGADSITYISRGGATQDAERKIMQRWTDETGTEVEHQEVADDTEMMELISSNPGDFDFTNPIPYAFALNRINHDGELFAEIDYDKIPNYDNVADAWQEAPFLQGHDYGTFYYNNSQGIAYNTEKVDGITSWDDIKKSQYEGRLSLHDSGISRFANCCAYLGLDVAEAVNDEELFDEVFAEIQAQHQNVFNYWVSGDQWMRLLREEQAHLSSGWGGRVEELKQDGHPIEYTIPEEGALTYATAFTIVAESDKKDLVYDLLDFIYERENAVAMSQEHGYPIPLEDPPEEITQRYDYAADPSDLTWIDWNQIIPKISDLQQAFNEVKSS